LGYEEGSSSNDTKMVNIEVTKKKEDSIGLEDDGFTWIQSRRKPYAGSRNSQQYNSFIYPFNGFYFKYNAYGY